ncbi:MAG: hypothetical protein ACTHUY_11320 [Flaviflexus sp.]|uniref:hypothetical protein n=1 Tax=Flaviflexus sp. TaxID=1969482 RepID=UPI003F8DB08C
MRATQPGVIPLAHLSYAAVGAMDYETSGKLALIRTNDQLVAEVRILDMEYWKEVEAPEPAESAIALIFPDTHDLNDPELLKITRALHKLKGEGGFSWDVIISHGGVRFRIYSNHGWLDEPESDAMTNDRLDTLIEAFDGPRPEGSGPMFSLDDAEEADDQWRRALQEELEGTPPTATPATGSLQMGSIRDTIIVWAVGKPGADNIEVGQAFVPPSYPPDRTRIDAALTLLAKGVGEPDGVHALACAAYLAWWCGYSRLATHLYFRAKSTRFKSRLADLVWTALQQGIVPPWWKSEDEEEDRPPRE